MLDVGRPLSYEIVLLLPRRSAHIAALLQPLVVVCVFHMGCTTAADRKQTELYTGVVPCNCSMQRVGCKQMSNGKSSQPSQHKGPINFPSLQGNAIRIRILG